MNSHKNVMITLNDISILIVTAAKSISRLKSVYNHVRHQYPNNEIVIVYDNVNENILKVDDPNLIQIPTNTRVYVSIGYNLAIKNSTKPGFVFLHDDTYTAPDFLENLIPHIQKNTFANFIQIEPPKFHSESTLIKPIQNFGLDENEFDKNKFDEFSKEYISNLPYNSEPFPFGGFFMAGYKESFLDVGGFDEDFQPYFFEDSDLMVRLHLKGYRFVLVLNSIVYHIGSLTSRGTKESDISHETTHRIFLNKWKVEFEHFKNYTMLHDIPYKKILTKINCINCNKQLEDYLNIISEDSLIEVLVDGSKLTQQEFGYLQSLSYILQNIDGPGTYQIGSLEIKYK